MIADGLVEIGAEREEISAEATFETLDVDSLDLVEMAQIIDDEFGVDPDRQRRQGHHDRRPAGRPGDRQGPGRDRNRVMSEPVLITGFGAVTPLGVGADALTERWIAGESGIEGGEGACSEFEPTDFLSRKEARRSDRFTQLAVAAADEALGQAGWEEETTGRPRPGRLRDRYRDRRPRIARGAGRRPPRQGSQGGLAALGAADDGQRRASAAIAMRHGIHGASYGVVSACAAGAHAIGAAVGMIRSGQADCVVTGGAEATLIPIAMAAFATIGATSPTGLSRPFDSRRDGFVMGEGAGVLVLESESSAARARRRGRSAASSATPRPATPIT